MHLIPICSVPALSDAVVTLSGNPRLPKLLTELSKMPQANETGFKLEPKSQS